MPRSEHERRRQARWWPDTQAGLQGKRKRGRSQDAFRFGLSGGLIYKSTFHFCFLLCLGPPYPGDTKRLTFMPLGTGTHSWTSSKWFLFAAPLVQDYGCVCSLHFAWFLPLLRACQNLVIKINLKFHSLFATIYWQSETTWPVKGVDILHQHTANLFYDLGHVAPSLRFLSGELHPGGLICTGVTGSL